jgi:hypothetical protein
VVQEDGAVAELLNKFFSSVFTREDTTNIPDPEPTGCREDISTVRITAKEVKAKIKKLEQMARPVRMEWAHSCLNSW